MSINDMNLTIYEYVLVGRLKKPSVSKPIKYIVTARGCWECISHGKNFDGYTQVCFNGHLRRLHRLSFNQDVEPIKPGNVVLHKCDNVGCFNPEHLEQGTQLENIQDMVKKRRGANKFGTRNPRSILKERDVFEIKHFLKYTNFLLREIGSFYGVEQTAIFAIKSGKRFTEIVI